MDNYHGFNVVNVDNKNVKIEAFKEAIDRIPSTIIDNAIRNVVKEENTNTIQGMFGELFVHLLLSVGAVGANNHLKNISAQYRSVLAYMNNARSVPQHGDNRNMTEIQLKQMELARLQQQNQGSYGRMSQQNFYGGPHGSMSMGGYPYGPTVEQQFRAIDHQMNMIGQQMANFGLQHGGLFGHQSHFDNNVLELIIQETATAYKLEGRFKEDTVRRYYGLVDTEFNKIASTGLPIGRSFFGGVIDLIKLTTYDVSDLTFYPGRNGTFVK